MSNLLGFKLPTSSIIKNPCPLNDDVLFFSLSPILKMPTMPSTSRSSHNRRLTRHHNFFNSCQASVSANVEVEEGEEETTKVAGDYTMTQICDKIIEFFLNEKPRVKQWRKYLALRDEWRKYRESFYDRCRTRAETESDSNMKQKLRSLASKVKRIDDEMERHSELLKEIQDSPTDLNALVTRRRKDFTGEFFSYLTTVAKTYDSLEDRDDPEERFSALAIAFSPSDEQEADKIPDALCTTPKELHKWVKIMLDAYQLNKEETNVLEAKKMSQPVVIQRLFILKDTIETEYLEKGLEEGTVLSQMKRGNSEQIDSQPEDLL